MKALDMGEPKKLVIIIFDTIKSAKLRFALFIRDLSYQFYLFFEPKILTNTSAMTTKTILTKIFTS